MNELKTVQVIVEGQTENRFVKDVLAPYWAMRNIFVSAPVIRTHEDKRTGTIHKGGDIRFERVKKQVGRFLQQRPDTIVASFVDYYGLKDWPGYETLKATDPAGKIAERLNAEAQRIVAQEFSAWQAEKRYVPFMAVHEFEALLFSDSDILAQELSIPKVIIDDVLKQVGSPEEINNSYATAPSRRLETWTNGLYGKTSNGIVIAQKIGIDTMRRKCHLFDNWMHMIEQM
ncbi:MAG: DUF4276 family protein [Oligosphaeraceae bacterium]